MINEVKVILQIACLAALLIASIIASVAFFRLYGVLGDFRDSLVLQPVGPAAFESVESIVEDLEPGEAAKISALPQEGSDISRSKSKEDLIDNTELEISGVTDETAQEELAEGHSAEETETNPRSKEKGEIVQAIDTENICGRTPEIQNLLIERLSITRCRDITGEELLRVRTLELDRIPLKVGDLDGFKNLTTLAVYTEETAVGLFDDLESLEYLRLGLETPPPVGLFGKLGDLQRLELHVEADADADDLAMQGMFEGLNDLESLKLNLSNPSGDYAVSLLTGSLTGMPKLQELEISNVSRVESGTFRDLPALRSANLDAIDLPDHLTKPSIPTDTFIANPDLGRVYLSGFQELSRLEFNSLNVVCRMQNNMDLRYGVEFKIIVDGKVVEVVDYDWDGELLECTLRVAPVDSENWEEVRVEVPPLPQSRRN